MTRKWHPEYAPYILMEKNGIHIINLDETIQKLNKALAFTSEMAQKNGEFLFVGTKKQARDIIQQEADRCGMFYVVERWLGGTLTNFSTIKKSIKRLQQLEKEGSKIYEDLTKKEVQMLNRERIKLADQHRGIKDMKRLPDVIVVVDANYEITAVREARLLEIPVIGIVDTNTNPNSVDYPIPANDDSIRTIQLIIAAVADEIRAAADKESVREEVIAKEDKEQTEEQADVAEVVVDAVAVEEELNDPVVEDEPAETGSANDESTTEQSAEVPVEENNSGKEDEEETEKLEEAEVK